MGAAGAWKKLYMDWKAVPGGLPSFDGNGNSYLGSLREANAGKSPTVVSAEAAPSYDGFTGDVYGLYLGASCYAKLAGSKAPKIDKVIDTLMQELLDNYQIATAGDAMAGCWSPSIRPGTDNGMFYGFWAGEILRGIALYIEVKAKRGA